VTRWIADVELSSGSLLVVESPGGTFVLRNVDAPQVGEPFDDGALVEASDGAIAITDSELGQTPGVDNLLRGNRATGDASVVIQDSLLRGGGGTFVEIEGGRFHHRETGAELHDFSCVAAE